MKGRWLLGTYRTECDSGCSQANEAAIPGMGLMNSICILVAKLLEDIVKALEILGAD